MRVIAGSARRIQLKTIEGNDTRPTTDRIKETLFNIIAPYLADCRFLDLFSGSGAIGIEALSRGASRAYFVEKNPKAMQCIRENLEKTRLSPNAVTIQADVVNALSRLDGEEPFDYIFMDPPYHSGAEAEVMERLRSSSLVNGDTVVIIEALKDADFSWLEACGWEIIKEKKYKTNKHIFAEIH